jgi:hypothetical protein
MPGERVPALSPETDDSSESQDFQHERRPILLPSLVFLPRPPSEIAKARELREIVRRRERDNQHSGTASD